MDSVPSLAVQAAHNLPSHRQGLPDHCRACRGWNERCTRAPHRERRRLLSPTRVMPQEASGNRWPLHAPATSLPPKVRACGAVPRQLPEGITLQASAQPAFGIWLNSDRLPSKTRDVPVPRRICFRIGAPPGNAGPTHSTEPETASHDRGTQIRPTGLHAPLETNELIHRARHRPRRGYIDKFTHLDSLNFDIPLSSSGTSSARNSYTTPCIASFILCIKRLNLSSASSP